MALASSPDGRMRLTELADAANMSQSRLTHRLETMIERGHVDITADETSARADALSKIARTLCEHEGFSPKPA